MEAITWLDHVGSLWLNSFAVRSLTPRAGDPVSGAIWY
jgi:hypothetical protein